MPIAIAASTLHPLSLAYSDYRLHAFVATTSRRLRRILSSLAVRSLQLANERAGLLHREVFRLGSLELLLQQRSRLDSSCLQQPVDRLDLRCCRSAGWLRLVQPFL